MYKKADCIELIDLKTTLTLDEKIDFGLVGHTDYWDKKAFFIDFFDIEKLASAFGLELDHRFLNPFTEKYENLYDFEFRIKEGYNQRNCGNEVIVSIECEIIDSQLLNIKITTIYPEKDQDYNDSEQTITDITYHGNFSIWWSKEDKN
jgi:hypothetical protein